MSSGKDTIERTVAIKVMEAPDKETRVQWGDEQKVWQRRRT
jgi:hypothetical protein